MKALRGFQSKKRPSWINSDDKLKIEVKNEIDSCNQLPVPRDGNRLGLGRLS